MSLRARLERAAGLGPRDDPRMIAVAARRVRVETPVVSAPGARLRLVRTGADGELGRLLLWCVRSGVPVELADGAADEVWLDGVRIGAGEARGRLRA